MKPSGDASRVKLFPIPATRIAEEVGNRLFANLVVLGFFSAITGAVSADAMKKALPGLVPDRFLKVNLQAFDKGYEHGIECAAKAERSECNDDAAPAFSSVIAGHNIAATVDVKRLADEMGKDDGVVFSKDYVYMCSDPGQKAIVEAIKEHKLDSVVVSCCSPSLHEKTFRDASEAGGVNQFQCEIANIREQCAWVHKDRDEATAKAIKITRSAVRRVSRNEPLTPVGVPVTRRAVVIGGGIAGIQTALDIANAGIEVVLVEKQATIGGHMLQLSETFPTLDCSQCILSPKMVEVSKHPKITLMTAVRGDVDLRLRRQLQGEDAPEGAVCRSRAVQALRRLHAGLPDRHVQRIRRRA